MRFQPERWIRDKKMKKSLIALIFLFSPLLGHALTVSQIRDNIRLIVKDNDPSRRRYSDTQLLAMENEAQRDISNATWIVWKSTSFPLVSGSTYYSIPSDSIEIMRLTREYKLIGENTFDKLDSDNVGAAWELIGGTPVDYFQDSSQPDKIGIKPFPNTSSSTGTIRMQYVAQPVDLVSDSDIPYNAYNRYLPYNDLIVYYVATRIFMLEGDANKMGVYSQLYESRVKIVTDKVGSHPNYLPSFSGTRTGK